jgi:anti-sigma B factor antagonist
MSDHTAQVMPVVVELPAEIDVTNSEQVYQQLVAVLAPGVDTVVADMTATIFCDSSGVHAIMHAYETAGASDVRIRLAVSPSTSVRRVLQLIGVSRLIPVYSTLEEALAAGEPAELDRVSERYCPEHCKFSRLLAAAHRDHRHVVLRRPEGRHDLVGECLDLGASCGGRGDAQFLQVIVEQDRPVLDEAVGEQ